MNWIAFLSLIFDFLLTQCSLFWGFCEGSVVGGIVLFGLSVQVGFWEVNCVVCPVIFYGAVAFNLGGILKVWLRLLGGNRGILVVVCDCLFRDIWGVWGELGQQPLGIIGTLSQSTYFARDLGLKFLLRSL